MNFNNKKNILIQNLSFGFSDKELILNNINFDLVRGQIVAIIGPSGCGKSTILRLLAGILTANSGTIDIFGQSPKQLQLNKKIGIAFQDSCLIEWLTVKENILIPTKIGIHLKSDINNIERANYLIELVGLTKYQNSYPNQLSGGMKQRVSFARALINKPELLLLDEPFSALDSFTKTKLMIDFSGILSQENTTTIFITHNIEEAVFLSDKLLVLSERPAMILEEINIDLPQPRRLTMYDSPDFEYLMKYCRNLLLAGKTHA
jgi:NitT/TauT family transport system ATP-binding protein